MELIKWEYVAMQLKNAVPEGELGEFGLKGWELVSMCAFGGAIYAYFKRPLQSEDKVSE